MGTKADRRKTVVVDGRLQLGLSLRILLCLACYLLLFCGFALLQPFLFLLSDRASGGAALAASREIEAFYSIMLGPLLLTFACMALHCILLSHRIAGPAYRLERTCEAIEKGNLDVYVTLRQGDHLRRLADGTNRMISSLRRDVAALKRETRALVEEGRQSAQEGSPDVTALLARGERIASRLERYVLSADECVETRPAPDDERVRPSLPAARRT
ncbi:MAG: hypothetical protein ACYTDY_01760 [Planctomycetota bacterium]|jgi:methyl-accepting chemotaxis protein